MIKDVMTYGFQGVEEPKIGPHKEPQRVKTGFRKSYRMTDTRTLEVDIDPAEFFDPEEFGYRRRDIKSFDP
jgi:hypothetical protein